MSWDCWKAEFYNEDGSVDIKKELDNNFKHYGEVLESQVIGPIYYAAIKHKDGVVRPIIGYTPCEDDHPEFLEPDEHGINFGVAEYTDIEGPGACECPDKILDLLTPTDNEFANSWRTQCRKHNELVNKLIDKSVNIFSDLMDITCEYDSDPDYVFYAFCDMLYYNLECFYKECENYQDKDDNKI